MTMIVFLILAIPIRTAGATCLDGTADCKYKMSDWSDCDPCTHTRSRRILTTRSNHGYGLRCPMFQKEEYKSCVTTNDWWATGTCIRPDLVCNGDNDCGDYSDETNCTTEQIGNRTSFVKDCVKLQEMPNVDLPLSGYDILTGASVRRVLTSGYYDGKCRRTLDPNLNQIYRLPFNIDSFHFQTVADDSVTVQTYSNYHDYKTSNSRSGSDAFSFSLGNKFSLLSGKVSYSQKESEVAIFKSMNQENSSLFEARYLVQLSSFQLRNSRLMLDPAFRSAINTLPAFYSPAQYFDLFRDFGTHYLFSGSMGGRLRRLFIFDNKVMSKSSYSHHETETCLSVEANVRYMALVGNVGYNRCKVSKETVSTSSHVSALSKKQINDDQGGTSNVSIIFSPHEQASISTLEDYIKGVQANPALLSSQQKPICDLIRYSGAKNVWQILKLCNAALIEYLEGYDTGSCQACQNGGVAVKVDETCHCACPSGVVGQMCEMSKGIYIELQQLHRSSFLKSADQNVVLGNESNSLRMKTDNPYPLTRVNTPAEQNVARLRASNGKLYALKDDGKLNVYTTFPTLMLQTVLEDFHELVPSLGFDVDHSGNISTLDASSHDLFTVTSAGIVTARIPKGNISNFCWRPVDLTTTCKGDLIVADGCNDGRFFVLKVNDSSARVLQYNTGDELTEIPIYAAAGPADTIYVLSKTYVTVYSRKLSTSPYTFNTTFAHEVDSPRALFADITNRLFLLDFLEGENADIVVFGDGGGQKFSRVTSIHLGSPTMHTGVCRGLAGQANEIYVACDETGLSVFRS